MVASKNSKFFLFIVGLKMETQDYISCSSFEELFDMDLKNGSLIDMRSASITHWKENITKVVSLLSTNLISGIFVSSECYPEVLGRVRGEVSSILENRFGDSIIINGRAIQLNRFYNFKFLLSKLLTNTANKDKLQKLAVFRNAINDVDELYDFCPFVKEILVEALQNVQKRKKRLLNRKESEENSPAKKPKNDDDDYERNGCDKNMIENSRHHVRRKLFKRTLKELGKMTPEAKYFENNGETSSLNKARNGSCYICHKKLTPDDFQALNAKNICIQCHELNSAMRTVRCDLTGKFAVVTGARLKIGYETALKLLRDGCEVIATTRFPNDAALRYSKEPDFESWSGNLKIYPLDLLDINSIYKFTDYVRAKFPHLDILINNAAQTISRPYEFYRHLFPLENKDPVCIGIKKKLVVSDARLIYPQRPMTESNAVDIQMLKMTRSNFSDDKHGRENDYIVTFPEETKHRDMRAENCTDVSISSSTAVRPEDHSSQIHGGEQAQFQHANKIDLISSDRPNDESNQLDKSPHSNNHQLSKTNISGRKEMFPENSFDKDGQQIDLRQTNSWKYKLNDVPLKELLDVLTINTLGPFILVSQLRPLLRISPGKAKFIVNVSAMEGQFHRKYKSCDHPHTNMAKAALNMLTRTSGIELKTEEIYMTSVDTGWVTDERPTHQVEHERRVNNWEVPLDCVDGASRIYHPIVHGMQSGQMPYFAVFLKNYKPHPW